MDGVTKSRTRLSDWTELKLNRYGCESWAVKKAEHRRIDAFEMWCWRRLLRVPWTARRSIQSVLKEINSEYSQEGLMLRLNHQYFGHQQHARPPCPSPTLRVYPNPCPMSRWCHPAVSSSVILFSSCPNPSQHHSLFQWVNTLHEVAKVLEFQL